MKIFIAAFWLYGVAVSAYSAQTAFFLRHIRLFAPAAALATGVIFYFAQKSAAKTLFVLSASFWIFISITFMVSFTNTKIFVLALFCTLIWGPEISTLSKRLKRETPSKILNTQGNINIGIYTSKLCEDILKEHPILAYDPKSGIIASCAVSSLFRIIYAATPILWTSPVNIYGLYWFASIIFSIEGILVYYDRYYEIIFKDRAFVPVPQK